MLVGVSLLAQVWAWSLGLIAVWLLWRTRPEILGGRPLGQLAPQSPTPLARGRLVLLQDI